MKWIFFSIPLAITIDLLIWTSISSLLSEQSDIALAIGISLICIVMAAHYFLIKYIISKIKL